MMREKKFKRIEEIAWEKRQTWGQIKKKVVKELLLELYVIRMKNTHRLTIPQAKQLLSTIFMLMIFKLIKPDDIEFADGHIRNIRGITISPDKSIVLDPRYTNIQVDTKPNIIVKSNLMSDQWDKYIKGNTPF